MADSADKERVTFLSAAAGLGGAERSLGLLLRALREERQQGRAALISLVDGPLVEDARALGVDVRVLPLPVHLLRLDEAALADPLTPLRLLRSGGAAGLFLRQLRALLRELRPDLLHANGLKAHLLGALARPAGCALVWHVHDYLGSRGFSRRALRLLASRAAGALAVSQAQGDDVRRALRGRLPVEVVWNAVELARFSPAGPRADLAQLAGLQPAAPGTLQIGLVATYAPWKGHRTFLAAGARLLARLPAGLDARLYVVGGPIYDTRAPQLDRAQLLAWTDELALRGRVGLIPFQPDPAPIYRALDVVVHASTAPEPFGLVIGEALACGRPVVATTTAGAVELFRPDQELLLAPPGDVEALARALDRLARDPAARERVGDAAGVAARERLEPALHLQRVRRAWRRFSAGLRGLGP